MNLNRKRENLERRVEELTLTVGNRGSGLPLLTAQLFEHRCPIQSYCFAKTLPCRQAMGSSIGKTVGDHTYVHVSALGSISPEWQERASAALQSLSADARAVVNVVKVHTQSRRVSLLVYPEFEAEDFPVLSASWTESATGGFRYRSYDDSSNPPILHRKELLVTEEHPRRAEWAQRTAVAESLGLFDNVRSIGFLANWERLIAEKSYRLCDGEFVPLGNTDGEASEYTPDNRVRRHLTALTRSTLSAPVQQLLRLGLLTKEQKFFDFGCGRGDDVSSLREEGYDASGWDPYFAPDSPVPTSADAVNIGFVINVIEDPVERVEALHRAFAIAGQTLVFGVMLETTDRQGKAFSDGVLTGRGTFQKYYNQGEIKDFVEQVLDQEAFMVAPGIGLVFKDKVVEQQFLAARCRGKTLKTRLIQESRRRTRGPREVRTRVEKVRGPTRAELTEAALTPVLDAVWELSLDLGRWPSAGEAAELPLTSEVPSLAAAIRHVRRRYDMRLLERARNARMDDLSLYFALQQFERRPKYKELPPALQLDISEFFGTYTAANAAGIRLLMQTADTDTLVTAATLASAAGTGWLQGEEWLQVDMRLVERLPAVLRCYVGTGMALAGNATRSPNLVKLHLASRKVSFFEYDDWDATPLPRLSRRVKVNLQTRRCDVFEYGERQPKPVLYRKSRFMHEEQEGYPEQFAFDEELEKARVLDVSEDDFGPTFEELQLHLSKLRLEVQGSSLVPSSRIPLLDAKCGAHLTYRQLVECGATQAKLQLPNRPVRAETYNALHGLASEVLDPVIDYFGGIELTYGFCSHALSRHIKARVAPRLDQHAGEELGRSGQKICSRGGAACDFIVKDEDMREVARWIAANLPFDRLYFYGADRPIHVSWSKQGAREAFALSPGPSGRLIPKRLRMTGCHAAADGKPGGTKTSA